MPLAREGEREAGPSARWGVPRDQTPRLAKSFWSFRDLLAH